MYNFSSLHVLIVTLLQIIDITAGQNYTQFCGYEQKCDKDYTDVGVFKKTCCQPCECDDVCLERGTCCADKDGRTRNVAKQQCFPGGYVKKSDFFIPFYSHWYFVRASCPDTFTNLSVKHKCEKETVETLDDVVLVSSVDGSIVYKNKFCGLCHGEKRTLPWNVEILNNCFRFILMENMTETYLHEIIVSKCHLHFKRPEVFSLHTICFENTIMECNKTGLWERYDSKLESLCLDPSETLYYYDKRGYVYSNLYCFLCNVPANVVPKTCKLFDTVGKTTSSLASLVDFKKGFETNDQKHIRTMAATPCTQDQIYDTFLGSCKQLLCPILLLPINGLCVPYIDVEVAFRQSVRLTPEEHLNVTESLKTDLKSEFNNIIRQLGFGKCAICTANMNLKKKVASTELYDLYVIFDVSKNKKCAVDYIYSKVYTHEKGSTYVTVTVNQRSLRLKVFIDDAGSQQLKQMDRIHSIDSPFYCAHISLGRGSSCPKVKLSMEEYFHVLFNHSNAEKLLIYPSNDDHNETMEVCIEDYVVVPGKSSGNDNTLAISVMAVLIIGLCLALKL